jgi:hypothetical protein
MVLQHNIWLKVGNSAASTHCNQCTFISYHHRILQTMKQTSHSVESSQKSHMHEENHTTSSLIALLHNPRHLFSPWRKLILEGGGGIFCVNCVLRQIYTRKIKSMRSAKALFLAYSSVPITYPHLLPFQ